AVTTRRPRRRRLVGLVLVLALALGGLLGWRAWQRTRPPAVPEVPLHEADPALVAAIERARQKVQSNPRSADDWGRLGMMLLANGFELTAGTCFGHAERFDNANPRWPYYQGLVHQNRNDEVAVACLRRAVALADQHDAANSEPRVVLAEMLFHLDQTEEAEQVLRQVSERGPLTPNAVYVSALLADRRNEPQ